MNDSFNHTQIQQIKLAMKQVLVDELGENYLGRLDRIENKVDMACKISKDADEELTVTQAKVDDHEIRIAGLESNFAQA